MDAALDPYIHPHVLVIDELGYVAHAADAANVLYQVVNERYLKRPILVTTKKPLAAWGDVVHDGDLAEAIVDRLLERGAHFALRGRSYRTRHLKGYARLFGAATLHLDPRDDNILDPRDDYIAGDLAFVFIALGEVYGQQSNQQGMLENFQRAVRLSPDTILQRCIRELRAAAVTLPLDTTSHDTAAARSGGAAGRDTAKR